MYPTGLNALRGIYSLKIGLLPQAPTSGGNRGHSCPTPLWADQHITDTEEELLLAENET